MILMHCKRPMVADYTVSGRTNHFCANQCGHRSWSGVDATLKRTEIPISPRRPCHLCGLALPTRSQHQTKYHKHCRAVIKRLAAKAYAKRVAAKVKA